MHAPQLIYLALVFIGLGISLAQHGKNKTGQHSFGQQLIATALALSLLFWGGFFTGGV